MFVRRVILKSYIRMELLPDASFGPRTNPLYFGDDLDYDEIHDLDYDRDRTDLHETFASDVFGSRNNFGERFAVSDWLSSFDMCAIPQLTYELSALMLTGKFLAMSLHKNCQYVYGTYAAMWICLWYIMTFYELYGT